MKIIESVKAGTTGGGMACGPVWGYVTAEMKIRDGSKVCYAGLQEIEDTVAFYQKDESIYDELINDEFEDDGYVDEYFDYEGYENSPATDPEKDALIRYLIYVVRSDWDDCNAFIARTEGKNLMEIDIPKYEDDDWDDDGTEDEEE